MDVLLEERVKAEKERGLKIMKRRREEGRKTTLLLLLNPNYECRPLQHKSIPPTTMHALVYLVIP